MAKRNKREMEEEIRELYQIVRDQEIEIAALKKKIRSLNKKARQNKDKNIKEAKTWKIKVPCKHCLRQTEFHVSFIEDKVYLRKKLNSLLSLLRKLGYLVNIPPNKDSLSRYRKCESFKARKINTSSPLSDLEIPDEIPEDLLKDLLLQEETPRNKKTKKKGKNNKKKGNDRSNNAKEEE